MWFKSVFLKSLRDYRVAILGWGIGMGLVIVSPMASVSELVKTPEARAALLSLAASFSWNADAVKADTIGGYATFKIGIFIFLITSSTRFVCVVGIACIRLPLRPGDYAGISTYSISSSKHKL